MHFTFVHQGLIFSALLWLRQSLAFSFLLPPFSRSTTACIHCHAMASSDATGDNDKAPSLPFIKCCIVQVQPDRADEFAKLCQVSQAKSIATEPGCLRLDVLRVVDNKGHVMPHKFIVYEIFQDQAAYEHHVAQPYSQDIGAFVQSGGVTHEDAYVAETLALTE